MIGLGAPTLALFIFGGLFNPWTLQHLPRHGWALTFFSPQIYFLFATLVILSVRHRSLASIGFHKLEFAIQTFIGIALGLIPALLTVGTAALLALIDRVHPFLKAPLFGGTPLPFDTSLPRLFTLLVLAPLSEELFFRGVLLRALRENYSTLWAVIFSSVVFMAGHGGFHPGPLMLGLIVAPVALRTGSLIPGMIFHAISNAYAPIVFILFPNIYKLIWFLFQ